MRFKRSTHLRNVVEIAQVPSPLHGTLGHAMRWWNLATMHEIIPASQTVTITS
jgi:hypothetical protein